VMVQAYDVTDLVQLGDNAMGLSVAPGWYSGCVGMFGPYQYGTKPHAWAQLHIECEDGSHHQIVSDASWRASRGPVRYADMLMGEIFDAREEIPGWAEAGQPQSGNWQQVQAQELSAFSGKLAPHIGPPVRVVMELPIQSIKELSPGVYIVDFGQNVVGWARMQVEGERGTCVRLRFAEMLNEDGSVYVTNLRSARATDVYVLKGEGTEVFEPSATFHGFRYMEVTGYPRIPTEADFTACVVASDTPVTAKLETSDALLNQLYSNIVWGQRDNFLSVPTDCPQRDERLGWTGDAQIFARTAAYNMDVASFFTKWMRDVGDAQRESGAVTNVVPHLGWLQDGIAAWADAVVIVPWTIWKMYGDKRILVESYSSMCKHMEYMRQTAPAWLRPAAGFGDWLSIEAETPKDLLATAYFGYCAKLMLEIADVIGEAEDAERYRDWLSQIRLAFNEAYVSKDGALLGETQTAYVLALHMDLLPEELRASAAKRLVADIQTKGNHLSTGFIGVSYLLPVLCESGYPEVAYSLLEQRTFPSWLYSVLEGATTIWERWNGWTKEHGFYSAVMNSFNHYSLGSVGEWMFRYMAGIELDPAKPGFKKMILRPWIGGSLTYVNAEYESMYGAIKSGWSLEESSVVYSVSIPANTEATLILPVGRAKPGSEEEVYIWSDVTRYQAALEQKGLILLSSTDQETQFHALPGSYKFVWNK
jgi:alpha-L-rhamnosidase